MVDAQKTFKSEIVTASDWMDFVGKFAPLGGFRHIKVDGGGGNRRTPNGQLCEQVSHTDLHPAICNTFVGANSSYRSDSLQADGFF